MQTNADTMGLFHEINTIREGKFPIPRMAILGPTYKCNQKCYYCFFDHMKSDQTMTKDQLKETIDQLADLGVKGVEWCGAGEPLLTPGLVEIFEYAMSKGLKQGLLTNGVYFKNEIAETFLRVGSYVRFSLDTIDRDLYKQIRGVDDCAVVLENIQSAINHKAKYSYPCQISIKIAHGKENTLENIQQVHNWIEGKRIFSVHLKNIWDKKGIYYNSSITMKSLRESIEGHNQRFLKKIKFRRVYGEKCWITPVQLDIDAFGDIFLCCYYMYRREAHRIGNIFKTPLKELWGSEEHKKKIAAIKPSECNKHDCRFMNYMRCARHYMKTGEWAFI